MEYCAYPYQWCFTAKLNLLNLSYLFDFSRITWSLKDVPLGLGKDWKAREETVESHSQHVGFVELFDLEIEERFVTDGPGSPGWKSAVRRLA
jgi:hypothetical protein